MEQATLQEEQYLEQSILQEEQQQEQEGKIYLLNNFRQQLRQLQHYTGQLAKDTATQLKLLQDLQPPGDGGARDQRERLQDEFTKALDNFQRIQREAAEKERQKLEAARLDQEVTIPGPGEGFGGQSRTQMMIEEEDRLKELEDRERAMRQLESDITDVNTIFKVISNVIIAGL